MPLAKEFQDVLDFIASRNVPALHELSPAEAREAMLKAKAIFSGEEVALPRVESRTITGPNGDIGLRLYAASDERPLPVLVYLHGGGWVIGDLNTHDDLMRRIAHGSGCLVVSVDYRLAPEHKFPIPVEDCYYALTWVAENAREIGADAGRIAVGGDSAGGNLAAVVAQLTHERGGPRVAFQLLIYPVVDHDFSRPSMRDNAEGYMLTAESMRYFWAHYVNEPSEAELPMASPLRTQNLAGLPPAHIMTAEFDPLRDEGEEYAKRLQAAGVPATMKRYDGYIHGFVTYTKIPGCLAAIDEVNAVLRGALGT